MEKDKFYIEACEDAREMAHHGYHWTDDTVEKRAEMLRNLTKIDLTDKRPPAAYRYE